jgi:hypothetical protein
MIRFELGCNYIWLYLFVFTKSFWLVLIFGKKTIELDLSQIKIFCLLTNPEKFNKKSKKWGGHAKTVQAKTFGPALQLE